MTKTLILTVFRADVGEIRRKPDGSPIVETSEAQQAVLLLATPTGVGSWALESWSDAGSQVGMTTTDGVVDGITETVRALFTDAEE